MMKITFFRKFSDSINPSKSTITDEISPGVKFLVSNQTEKKMMSHNNVNPQWKEWFFQLYLAKGWKCTYVVQYCAQNKAGFKINCCHKLKSYRNSHDMWSCSVFKDRAKSSQSEISPLVEHLTTNKGFSIDKGTFTQRCNLTCDRSLN